jgi:hypothetical protein
MKITLEQIDELRKRAKVGYKEAKDALEKFDGDMVDALAYLDGEKKINSNFNNTTDFIGTIKSIISKGNRIKLNVSKNDKTILNVPITAVILIGVLTTPIIPLYIIVIILAVFTGCRIRFINENGMDYSINKHIEKVSIVVNDAAHKITEDIKNA